MIQSKKFHYLWISILLVNSLIYTGCNQSASIPPDKARLCGRYSKEILQALEDSSANVQLVVLTYFADGFIREEVQLKDDGTFTIDLPVVCTTMCQIGLEGYYIGTFLSPGKKTEFELTMGKSYRRNLKMLEGTGWTEEEYKEDMVVFNDIAKDIKPNWEFSSGISVEEYQQHVINNLDEIKKEVEDNPNLSYIKKQEIKNSIRMSYLYGWILSSEETEFGGIQPLEKASDFTFLKYFKLNDPSEYYTHAYALSLKKILKTNVFEISTIGDTPVEEWLKVVKSTFSDLIGSDTGFFYDLLAANAYSVYQENEGKPLSDKQIENIRNYFQNKLYVDVLLAENEKTIEFIKSNQKVKPDVPKEELLNAIVSKYKGNVVVVDFWATWCSPCLKAIYGFEDTKEILADKNVVFVYLSSPTSEEKNWKTIARNFNGEHYCIDSNNDWNYIMDQYNFTGIPSYLIFDADGNLKHQFTGFPGNEKMQKMIEELLQ